MKMYQVLSFAAVMAFSMMPEARGQASSPDSRPVVPPNQDPLGPRSVDQQLASIIRELAAKEAQVKEGVAADVDLEPLRRQRAELEEIVATNERITSLNRPVDVQLKDSTLRQAAEALTRASGVTVAVDPTVGAATRITLTASRVPLATVLETIAVQGKLMIAPEPKGVILRTWPSLEINGGKQDFIGAIAPWSDEWRIPPTAGGGVDRFRSMSPFGQDVPLGPGGLIRRANRTPISPSMVLPSDLVPASVRSVPTIRSEPQSLTISAAGERLVIVAEPGVDPAGNSGAWLTVYELNAGQLKKVGTTFHKSAVPAKPARAELPSRNALPRTRPTRSIRAVPTIPPTDATRSRPAVRP